MLDTNEVEYETSTLYDALETYSNRLEEQNANTSSTNTTWPNYDVCYLSASSGDFLTSSIFQSCIYFMYSTVFLIALVGNGLVCFVVKTSPRMKTVTNYFIVNLAVGDILMTLFCVPFSFVSMLVLRYWPFGLLMCKIVNYTQAVSVLVSAYTLLAISIDRYMAIMRPLKPRLGKAAAKTVVTAVWGGALATAAPIAVVSKLERPTPWHQFCQADICLEQWEHAGQSAQYTCALLVLQFALPLAALIATYARIACAVWGGRPPGEAQDARDTRLQRSKRKMIKMMVIVVTVFTICWLPLNMFIVLWTIHEHDESWGLWPGMPYVWFASHWLAMSHSCYNPIIYCYMNARYRRGFKQAFACLFRIRLDTPSRHRSSVCEGVQMSVPECKKRFKSLRDQYNKKIKDGGGTGSGRTNNNWEYMELLSFLSDAPERRASMTNVHSERTTENDSQTSNTVVNTGTDADTELNTGTDADTEINTGTPEFNITENERTMQNNIDDSSQASPTPKRRKTSTLQQLKSFSSFSSQWLK